jgi:hypothetical protein
MTGQLLILSRTRGSAVGATGPRARLLPLPPPRAVRVRVSSRTPRWKFRCGFGPQVTFSQSRAAVHGSRPRPRGARTAEYAARRRPSSRRTTAVAPWKKRQGKQPEKRWGNCSLASQPLLSFLEARGRAVACDEGFGRDGLRKTDLPICDNLLPVVLSLVHAALSRPRSFPVVNWNIELLVARYRGMRLQQRETELPELQCFSPYSWNSVLAWFHNFYSYHIRFLYRL